MVKTWSTNQKHLALSSGEAELYAANKGVSEAKGIQSAAMDFGEAPQIRLHTDANAAIGIASRRGLGKVRHIQAQELWLQEEVRHGRVDIRKVSGQNNPADMLTKHINRDTLSRHLRGLNFRTREKQGIGHIEEGEQPRDQGHREENNDHCVHWECPECNLIQCDLEDRCRVCEAPRQEGNDEPTAKRRAK